jgi:lysozyme family protein
MADINKLSPKIAKWEGGFVNDPLDSGGATNMGITIATWKSQGYDKDGNGDIDVNDLKLLDYKDFNVILRKYWNRWRADGIKDQKLAEILVDWVWGSGKYGITIPQQMLGVVPDGIVGPKTLSALNSQNPEEFHKKIWNRRKEYLFNLVKVRPKDQKFLKGWLNRLNDFK